MVGKASGRFSDYMYIFSIRMRFEALLPLALCDYIHKHKAPLLAFRSLGFGNYQRKTVLAIDPGFEKN